MLKLDKVGVSMKFKDMNLPNKLTMLRILLVPVFVLFMSIGATPLNLFLALVIFVIASLTDLFDGKIARKYGLVTNFGKLMDPLADKVLVMSAMLCFVSSDLAPAWIVIVILTREFLVTSLRLIAAGEGTVIAADKWGKIKTVTQMIWIIWTLVLLFAISIGIFDYLPEMGLTAIGWLLSDLLMYASTFFTLLSGFNYVYKNRQLLFSDM
jgi:CDP-diacylglycerol--glycerol-3-phosphate 3-phosphatidyltransferase